VQWDVEVPVIQDRGSTAVACRGWQRPTSTPPGMRREVNIPHRCWLIGPQLTAAGTVVRMHGDLGRWEGDDEPPTASIHRPEVEHVP